jgi:hypothetical protein
MRQKLYLARSSGVAARRLGDEMMIMSGRDSTLFTLDEVATVIWESANGSVPLDEIVEQRICSNFDVDPVEALQDAEEFAGALAQHGILLVSREPIHVARPTAGWPV